MRVEEWRGRSRTSLELPFYPCAQGNENTRSIRQFEEGEGTCPPSKEIKDSARHPRRLGEEKLSAGIEHSHVTPHWGNKDSSNGLCAASQNGMRARNPG